MGNHTLEHVNNHPYLGIELSSSMNWKIHINQLVVKANRTLGLLRRNLSHCDKDTKAAAYFALVRPILDYCSTVWDPYTQSQKNTIENVQRRAARFIFNNYSRQSSVSEMINDLNWDSLETRRLRARLVVLYKETHGLLPSNIADHLIDSSNLTRRTTRRTSGRYLYHYPSTNKLCYQKSLYPRTIPSWNLLPEKVRCAPSVDSFKNQLLTLDLNRCR